MSRVRSVTVNWNFSVPVDRIWPVMADTARFNEAVGFPKHEITEVAQPDGSVRFVGRTNIGAVTVTWDEEPQNWVTNRWFRHCRRFRNGPFKSLCAIFRLRPNGTRSYGEYSIEIEPANLIGRLLLGTGFLRRTYKKFTELFADAEAYCEGFRDTQFAFKSPKLARGAAQRAAQIADRIETTKHGYDLAQKLANYLLTRPEADVSTLRPLALAKLWEVPERHAIEVCMEAVSQGLLGMRWALLCPRCQAGKITVATLKELPDGAHCATCNIDFRLNFVRNVELVFHPSPAFRTVDDREYCFMGPMSTPHVLTQLTVSSGEQHTEPMTLSPNCTYRIRTLEPGDECTVMYQGGSFPEMIAERDSIITGGPVPVGMVAFINRSERRLTFILEELAWRRDALTAHRATIFQVFRDLFHDEVLRPGDGFELDSVSLMFTDLKGSTAMYDRIGDPRAYVLVREHFDILGDAIGEHDGSIVKKIGDAVMAVFFNPADALECAIRIQCDIDWFNRTSGKEELTVKMGLHTGRCLSVNLNDCLDYYGSTVNRAARLQGESRGGDVVMSAEFMQDPEVTSLINSYSPTHETVRLKGFSDPISVWRIPCEQIIPQHKSAS